MKTLRRYIRGPKIESLDEFSKYSGPIWNTMYDNPIRHKAWYESMQYRIVRDYIMTGKLYRAERK